MIVGRQAILAAADYARKTGETKVRLEGAERSPDERHWLVTLGLGVGPISIDDLETLARPPAPRAYQCVRVDAETGAVVSSEISPVV